MPGSRLFSRIAASAVVVSALTSMLACGGFSNSGKSDPPANTYLYVAEGDVAQLHVESDGTLTFLSPATVAGPPDPGTDFVTVDPSGQYLFANTAILGGTYPVNQYVIGSDGTLTPNATPAVNVTGWSQLTFTPDGKFTFVPDFQDGVIDTYGLSSGGTLSQVGYLSAITMPANVQPTAFDPTGKFLYFYENAEIGHTGLYTYSIMEYAVANGVLTPLSPNDVAGPGSTHSLTVAANGFLYYPDGDHGLVTAFQIDENTGQLANAGSFATGTGPESAPSSISFNASGTCAFVVNGADNSVTQFTVNVATGALAMNGADVPTGKWPAYGAIDPSGQFFYVTNGDGTISQYTINNSGRLSPNGTFSLGGQSPGTMAFTQR